MAGVTITTIKKRPETIDFSSDQPKLNESVVLDMIRKNLKSFSVIHVFFTGTKIRVIRGCDYVTLDNAEKKDQLIGVYNKHDNAQPYIEKAIIKESCQAIREWYG